MKRAIVKNYETAKDKIGKNSVSKGLFFFVAIPTMLAIVYYYVIAADVYVSESKFSVNVEGKPVGASPLSALLPTFTASSNLHEAMVVREYITSAAMVETLDKEVGLRDIFDNNHADFMARIPRDLKIEDYVQRYKGKVEIILDEISGITTLRVRAFSPEESKKLADAIMNQAEKFVNQMAARVRADGVEFSKNEVAQAEKMVLDINAKLAKFRNQNKSFDPTSQATNIMGIASKLEQELAKTQTEIAGLRNYMQADSPKIQALEDKARVLQKQIDEQSGRLASDKGSQLADMNEEYTRLKLENQFALRRLGLVMASMESAQAESRKKSRYLLRIVEPTLPQEATEPLKFRQVLTIFFACLIGYTLGGLIIAAIKDHVRP